MSGIGREFQGDEFSNNLFSDLAPLLTLFGERVATQYLRHSTKHIENLIFACGPLGVLTAVTAAIRVGGDRKLKAMIGRAQEPDAVAEIELVSSTSSDICELWNGVGIVRVVGQPDILELVIYEESNDGVAQGSNDSNTNDTNAPDKEKSIKIYTRGKGLQIASDCESEIDTEDNIANMIPPNISLNTIGRSIGDWELRAVAAVGVLLQLGVLGWDGVVTYHLDLRKGGQKVPPYAFPLTVAGTLGLVLGMYLCAYIVEASTRELRWQPSAANASDKTGSVRIVWIQRHQTVGDQSFGSFAIYAPGNDSNLTLMTSHLPPSHKNKFHKLTLLASALSIIAFILQFVGLRAMHYSASIAQLIATVIMTMLRVAIRRHISQTPNDLSERANPRLHALPSDGKFAIKRLKQGFELDTMAMQIEKCLSWEVQTSKSVAQLSVVTGREPSDSQKIQKDGTRVQERSLAHKVMDTRIMLGQFLRSPWQNELSDLALRLSITISDITNFIWKSASSGPSLLVLEPGTENMNQISWRIPLFTRGSTESLLESRCEPQYITLSLNRRNHGAQKWTPWEADHSRIEALLQLWMSQLCSARTRPTLHSGLEALWLLCHPDDSESAMIADWWIGPSRDCEIMKEKTLKEICATSQIVLEDYPPKPDYSRIISYVPIAHTKTSESGTRLMADVFTNNLPSPDKPISRAFVQNTTAPVLGIQYVMYTFLCRISSYVNDVTKDTLVQESQGQGTVVLRNETLVEIAMRAGISGVISFDDAYRMVVYSMHSVGKLPIYERSHESFPNLLETVLKVVHTRRGVDLDAVSERERLRVFYSEACDAFKNSLRILLEGGTLEKACGMGMSCLRIWESSVTQPSEYAQKLREIMPSIVSDADIITTSTIEEHCVNSLPVRGVGTAVEPPFAYESLILAAQWGQATDVHRFIRQGADVQENDPVTGEVALDFAIRRADKEMVGLLLLSGAAMNHRASIIWWVIHWHVASTGEGAAKVTADECMGMILFLLNIGANPDEHKDGEPPLHLAVKWGLKRVVGVLLDARVSVDVKDSKGFSTLHHTSISGDKETMQLLLEELDADVNEANVQDRNRTAVHYAAMEGHEDALKLLLGSGGTINQRDSEGYAPLDHATQRNHHKIIPGIIEAGGEINGKNTRDGRTALHLAAGNWEVLRVLLELQNIDTDAQDANGDTALHLAAMDTHPHVQSVYLLLEGGAIPNKQNNDGKTALDLAKDRYSHVASTHSSSSELLQLHQNLIWLLENNHKIKVTGDTKTAFHRAACNEDEETLRMLLSIVVNPNANTEPNLHESTCGSGSIPVRMVLDAVEQDKHRWTSLHYASYLGYEPIVRILLDAGASVDTQENDGWAPLHQASDKGYEPIVRILLDAGASVDTQDKVGWTPLHQASDKGYEPIVRILLDAGASVDTQENDGWTPLYLASSRGYEPTVLILLDAGASVDTQDKVGWTPLHQASHKGYEPIVRILLDAGASVDTQDKVGWTPLHQASNQGHEPIVRILLDAGASVDTQKEDGCTPLHLVSSHGYEPIVRMLLDAGASVDTQDKVGWAPLHITAQTGHSHLLQLFVNRGMSIDSRTRNGTTSLHIATRHQKSSTVQWLLSNGASLAIKDNQGFTARYYADKPGGDVTLDPAVAKVYEDFENSMGMNSTGIALNPGESGTAGEEKVPDRFDNNEDDNDDDDDDDDEDDDDADDDDGGDADDDNEEDENAEKTS